MTLNWSNEISFGLKIFNAIPNFWFFIHFWSLLKSDLERIFEFLIWNDYLYSGAKFIFVHPDKNQTMKYFTSQSIHETFLGHLYPSTTYELTMTHSLSVRFLIFKEVINQWLNLKSEHFASLVNKTVKSFLWFWNWHLKKLDDFFYSRKYGCKLSYCNT